MGFLGVRTEAKTRIAHVIAGANILIEAFGKLHEHETRTGAAMAVLGIAILAFARFHRKLHESPFKRHMDSTVFALEATVQALIALSFFHQGKHALPFCYALASAAYMTLAVWREVRPAKDAEHA